nr:ribonuclease H-like domain-containing protein [Tanacetum cinerariifolium]
MYSIDLNNIVPHKDLTCLVAKASADECILWHRRLGHLNVKTMNKLVRHNLVRGLPTNSFDNDHTCTACLKGKQHKASCKSNQYKDAKTLFEAIQARFGGNDPTKKTQRTLLKQMYENFNAPITESLDSIFNRLQKIRNKADLDTMSFDGLYNNFKIVEQEVKRVIVSSPSSGSPNMALLSSPGSTNEVDTTSIQVSAISTLVSTVSSHDKTANLSNATVYAFLANQPNGSQLVHEDLEQIHEDDLEEIDFKWQLALLSMRARRYF